MRTLRQAALELRAIAEQTRAIADDLRAGGQDVERWAIARDLASTAHTIEAAADIAERTGRAAGEPEPTEIPAWVAEAAPGELVEMYGR